MKSAIFIFLAFVSAIANAQNKVETIANFGIRAADAAQTCQQFQAGHFHEDFLPTQSCGGVVAISAGWAGAAFIADRWLIRHHHPRLAHLQLFSAAGAAQGIGYTFTHIR